MGSKHIIGGLTLNGSPVLTEADKTVINERIVTLEQAVTHEPYGTDENMAYVKEVINNDLPSAELSAEISTLGGMTRKCTNLFDFETWKTTVDHIRCDITFDKNSVTISSTGADAAVASSVLKVKVKAGETYTISFDLSDYTVRTINYLFKNGSIDESMILYYGATHTFVADDDAEFYTVRLGLVNSGTAVTFSNIRINEGSTALPYEPYFEGLRSAPVTEVESVGANLIEGIDSTTISGNITYSINSDGSIVLNGTAGETPTILRLKCGDMQEGQYYCLSGCPQGGDKSSYSIRVYINGAYYGDLGSGLSFTYFKDTFEYIRINIGANTSITNLVFKPMLNKGPTALPYTSYVKHTLPIPEAVRNLDGYGWGINESVYNYIDFEKKQFVKRVKNIVADGLTYKATYQSSAMNYSFKINNSSNPVIAKDNVLCQDFPTISYNEALRGERCVYTSGNEVYISFGNESSVTTITACNEYLQNNPIAICYELAEPVITDISDILTDNKIAVENGGTLTFKNEYEYAVPSDVGYYVNVETSISKDDKAEIVKDVLDVLPDAIYIGKVDIYSGEVFLDTVDATNTITYKPDFESAKDDNHKPMVFEASYLGSASCNGYIFYNHYEIWDYDSKSFELYFHAYTDSGELRIIKLKYQYSTTDLSTPQSITAYFEEELSHEGDFKVKQTAVASPSASGSATAFIDTISQDENGNITVTKKNVGTVDSANALIGQA